MDSEKKMVEIVKSLVDVVGELAEDANLSERTQEGLDRAKREVIGLQTREDEEAFM
jgi:hypothetical protein